MNTDNKLFFESKTTLPVFLSTEIAECSLVCLAMIGSYYGHDIDINSLRQRFSISASGSNLRGVMRLAEDLGLATRALRVEMEALPQVAVPAIIHWDMNHFVVLKSVSRNSITIHDPVRGVVKLSKDEFSCHFTGVVLEVSRASNFKKIVARKKIKFTDFFTNITGHRAAIFYIITLSLALQILAFTLPLQMQLVVDKAIAGNDIDILLLIAISFGVLTVLNTLISTLREWTLLLLSSQFIFQIAGNIFGHLIRLSAKFFEKRHLGDILSRLSSIRQIQDAITQGVLSAVVDGTMIIFAGVALVIYSPFMALIVFTSVFICAAVTIISYPFVKNQSERSVNASAKEQTFLMETIRGVIPIKLMSGEGIRESSWRNLYSRSFNESLSLSRIHINVRFIEDLILGLQLVIIIYVGASTVIESHGFSLGMLLSFLAFRGIFVERTQALINRAMQFGTFTVYIERLGDFLIEPQECSSSLPVENSIHNKIVVNDTSFRYGSTDPLVLEKINLEINDGDFLAIIGRSGGGKTTLVKLLLGLQQPTEGQILLNGEVATPGLWKSWRENVGVVRQDDQLFSGTLAENIAFFDPDLDMLKVREAAAAAYIHDEIDKMPTKYLTPIGDMGSSLSGGQKQRILLARALYRSPKILILDEGTANLDPMTESLIADAIVKMNIIRVVIAHRPALVEKATRVVKIEDGKITVVR